MQSRYATNWAYRCTKLGTGPSNYTIMFSCRNVGMNILYKYDEVHEILEKNTESRIPRQVMLDAIYECNEGRKVAIKAAA